MAVTRGVTLSSLALEVEADIAAAPMDGCPPAPLGVDAVRVAVLNLAIVAHLSIPAGRRHGNRMLELRRVDPDEDGSILRYGSSSLRRG